jgi:hypothetical protein
MTIPDSIMKRRARIREIRFKLTPHDVDYEFIDGRWAEIEAVIVLLRQEEGQIAMPKGIAV